MTVRPATSSKYGACQSIDATGTTDHVWQMAPGTDSRYLGAQFRLVRLPRRMRVVLPQEMLLSQCEPGAWDALLVAEAGGQIRGYLSLRWQSPGRTARIGCLAVAPAFRRQGVARGLVLAARSWAGSQQADALVADASTKNHPAVSLLLGGGFTFCGFNEHYYGNRDIALFFVHKLG